MWIILGYIALPLAVFIALMCSYPTKQKYWRDYE